jgi:MFS family permease
MVVFGFLDSQTLLSGFSSVRLDSFVYTLDSFKQVKEHLTEDGVVSVSFAISTAWIEERLGRMLADVFGPEKVFIHRGTTGTTFVAGSVSSHLAAEHDLIEWNPTPEFNDLPLPTDDWPYLYLQARKIPAAYWQTLLIIALIIFALLTRTFPEVLRPNWHFWLLGAAFLLVEFKSITEMALLFGTTWIVNILAISGVLLMALGANLVVLRRQYLKVRFVYVLLFLSLGLNYLSPLDLLIGLSPAFRAIGSMILLSIPLFFAGLIFGESLRRAGETAGPLASNLSGSVAGGVLEYGSILWGIKSLYLIAAVIYFGSLLAFLSKRR